MWRRVYFLLILVRVYFALSPSYLHPDENFQGPEVIAGTSRARLHCAVCAQRLTYTGRVFGYPVHETWEFTSESPIRSTFPLWLAYGWPMYILRWLWEGFGYEVSPAVVYWALRILMLTLSVVMEDWAVHELVASPRARRVAVPLVASSYVTWTFQTHTFSNSIETLLVSWSLVLIQRIVDDKVGLLASVRLPLRDMQLTQGAEAFWHLGLVHAGGDDGRGVLQSHHLSGIHYRSGVEPVASLPAQVSTCCR
jgi:phosphatidylinositol glycan class Z